MIRHIFSFFDRCHRHISQAFSTPLPRTTCSHHFDWPGCSAGENMVSVPKELGGVLCFPFVANLKTAGLFQSLPDLPLLVNRVFGLSRCEQNKTGIHSIFSCSFLLQRRQLLKKPKKIKSVQIFFAYFDLRNFRKLIFPATGCGFSTFMMVCFCGNETFSLQRICQTGEMNKGNVWGAQ